MWFIAFCLLLGAVYAGVLYYRNSFIQDPTTTQKIMFRVLAVLRFATVSLLAFLLLSPYIKSKFTEVQKPIVVFVQDESESIKNVFKGEDSAQYVNAITQLTGALKENFEVDEYAFGSDLEEEVDFSFDNKLTNISNNLNELYSLYTNENVGAVILATDGIYNQGSNPIYVAGKGKFPIYTVALGDTIPQQDLKIEKAFYNRIVYLNDRFVIKADMHAQNFDEANTSLEVYDHTDRNNPQKLAEEAIEFTRAQNLTSAEFILDANRTGVRHYRLVLKPVNGEFTTANNYKDIFIDVLDGRQKVLIVANAPHPDLTAIKQAAESNKNYEVSIQFIRNAPNLNVEEYNVVILHQLPSSTQAAKNLIDKLNNSTLPVFFIAGSQSNLSRLNQIQNTVQINQSGNSVNQVSATVNENFSLFTFSDQLNNDLQQFPPLSAPFGEYKVAASASVMLKQKIGTVPTDYPLLVFDEQLGNKTAVLMAEGIWRWRLYNYLNQQSHDLFNELISKSIQYLSVKEDKRQFKVIMPKNLFYENEPVTFDAELYNDSYEMINAPDVKMVIIDEDGKEYPFQFNKTGNAYTLDAGSFLVGNFSYRATVLLNGKELSSNGQFTITPMQLEAFNTVANHQMLYQLSEQTGGKMYYPGNLNEMLDELTTTDQLKATMYDSFKTNPLINLKWIFFVLMGLLSIEWFTRKFQGGY